MSHRIQKTLGYGFSDIVPNDPRFSKRYLDKNGIFDYKLIENIVKDDDGGFLKHLERYGTGDSRTKSKLFTDFGWTLSDLKRTDSEILLDVFDFILEGSSYGLENVFMMKPLFGHKNWSRFNDIIDGYESLKNKQLLGVVTVFRWNALYPYLSFVDAENGEAFADIFPAIRMINGKLDKGIDLRNNPECLRDSKLDMLGYGSAGKYDTYAEYEKNVFSKVVESIVEFCNYFEIFKKNNTVYRMTPMLYTYWR
jgi:hypothetical protein